MRKTLKVLPFVLASGVFSVSNDASAGVLTGDYSLAVGLGERPLAPVEEGLEAYLTKRGYTEQFPGLKKSFVLREELLYGVCDVSLTKPRLHLFDGDTITFVAETNFSSSYLGQDVDTGSDYFPLMYEALDLGQMGLNWEIKLPIYLAASGGVVYSPKIFSLGKYSLAPRLEVTGGYGYFHANVDINMAYSPSDIMNEVIDMYGQEWFDENVGIPAHQTIHTTLDGHGPFVHPRLGVALHHGKWGLILQGGARFESSSVNVVEYLDGHVLHKGKAHLNISGLTGEALLEYNF